MKLNRRQKAFLRRYHQQIHDGLLVFFGMLSGAIVFFLITWFINQIQKPIAVEIKTVEVIIPTVTPIATPTAKPTRMPKKKAFIGTASYYSVDGCVGCNPGRIMANGERLDDSRLTVAFNRAPKNSFVAIRNLKNNQTVTAQVTDTGGFEKLNRIIDLTVATRDAIACSNLCEVEVTLL